MITSEKFEGVDVNLEISLFEYGLLVTTDVDKDGQHKCIYKVDESSFDVGYMSEKEVNEKINESWFEKESFLIWLLWL